ncbi:hypothetical protein [Spiroplasma clarkii]|uniref:Uncharacterized protein n=1 Tax=Spiroplasma clarkii TaxID=2139 RepID=A0A2K8KH17_9MOLU|nr:hypothetical protein [Spiroplasma clarkii]ATX70983.1 hypothetical protein SCLAR_v1c06660 [Spiroplasma clarkii]
MFKKYLKMDATQLNSEKANLTARLKTFREDIKKIERKIKKPCWWVLVIPLFGLFIFNGMVNKRKISTGLGDELIELKSNELYLELEIKFIEQKIEELKK